MLLAVRAWLHIVSIQRGGREGEEVGRDRGRVREVMTEGGSEGWMDGGGGGAPSVGPIAMRCSMYCLTCGDIIWRDGKLLWSECTSHGMRA